MQGWGQFANLSLLILLLLIFNSCALLSHTNTMQPRWHQLLQQSVCAAYAGPATHLTAMVLLEPPGEVTGTPCYSPTFFPGPGCMHARNHHRVSSVSMDVTELLKDGPTVSAASTSDMFMRLRDAQCRLTCTLLPQCPSRC